MDWDIYLRSLMAFGVVVALIGLTAWLGRRFGAGGFARKGRRQRRLSVLEVLPLDNRRRLVLVRRDEAEHLLLIGGPSDIVVERAAVMPTGFAANLAHFEEEDADQ
jgi:flagellar protein FliO/FliZ